MKPIYEENEETLEIAEQISCHIPPHLHKSMELVSVTEGTLEIGDNQGNKKIIYSAAKKIAMKNAQ